MSELIDIRDQHMLMRKQLLVTVSALALTAYIASAGVAKAGDADQPTVWIELGGQLEQMQGTTSPFTAPFMSTEPSPAFYKTDFFAQNQQPARFSSGLEGSITLQPQDSDWKFTAGIRYGRSNANRHVHHQTSGVVAPIGSWSSPILTYHLERAQAFSDIKSSYREQHMVLDFQVGRDVGIGVIGRDGTSTLNAGIRLAELTTSATATVYARPQVDTVDVGKYGLFHKPVPVFSQYMLTGHAQRSFHGVGPSLAWNASAALIGNREDGELMLDWGINGALLFGKQKTKTNHVTTATHYNGSVYAYDGALYPAREGHSTRSRSVTIPNLGGFAGLSVKYPNVKVALGYRADFFFGAMDTGIDTRSTKDVGFHGPFATVSIGLGG